MLVAARTGKGQRILTDRIKIQSRVRYLSQTHMQHSSKNKKWKVKLYRGSSPKVVKRDRIVTLRSDNIVHPITDKFIQTLALSKY